MENIRMLLADNMRFHRKLNSFSQQTLSELCDISHNYIGEIEACRKFPSAEILGRISVALNVTVKELFIDGNDQEILSTAYAEKLKASFNLAFAEFVDELIKQPYSPTTKEDEKPHTNNRPPLLH